MERKQENTVLLVEDESINQKLAAAILKKIGFTVDIADNGLEAVQMVEKKHYSMVLMDIQLPEISGYEAVRQIRSIEEEQGRKRVPIIAMTANDSNETRRKCIEIGMDDFITKPINPDRLMVRIAPWFGSLPNKRIQKKKTGTGEKHENLPAEVWNREQTLAFVGGDLELFCGLAEMFIEKNHLLIENIRRAIDRNDGPALREAAHSYKGAVSHFSAEKMRRLAFKLETFGRQQYLDFAPACFAELEEMAVRLVADLEREIALF
jgi:CheY-like chemotaxis protein